MKARSNRLSDKFREPPIEVRTGGFTLLEIMIAVGILSLIVVVTYSALSGIIRSKTLLDQEREGRFIANAVLHRLSRELQLAFQGIPLLPPRNDLKTPYQSKVNLIGEEKNLDDGRAGDSITFLALEGGQYLPDGGSHSGLVQITYRAEPDPDAENPSEAGLYLVREEVPYLRPYEKAYERSMIFPVTKHLHSIRFRYFDGESDKWLAYWGKEDKLDLPRMVEFSVEIQAPGGRIEGFTAAVPLKRRF